MSNKRLVVDENDVLIGVKSRDELDLSKDIYRVSCLWLTNPKGEVLIAQRGLTLHNGPGLYGPAVAGTVEEGETYETNIYKEAQEEIGLSEVQFKLGPKFLRTGSRHYFCQFFTATLDRALDEFSLDPREVETIAWVAFDALQKDIAVQPAHYVESMKQAVECFS